MSGEKSQMGLTEYLAQRVLDVKVESVPDDVSIRAGHALLDWAVLATVSQRVPCVQNLYEYLATHEAPAGKATVLGAGLQMSPDAAMLLNGTAGHVLDFDDAHLLSRVHPSAPLWPAILAYGELAQISGEQLLTAFAVGVDVQSRLAGYMGESHYRQGWHNTATLGTFGAAAAIGWLRGLNREQMCNAFSIAATMASGIRAAFGSPTKPLQVARASVNGTLAAGLAHGNFTGGDAIFDREDGFPALYADQISSDRPWADPGHWCIKDSVFKYHASCYGTQAPIEAALALSDIDVADIESVTVYVEPQYMTVCNIPRPVSATEAKFSLRHTVALALAGKDTAVHTSFEPQTINDADIARWRSIVDVKPDAHMPRANARVEVRLLGGGSDVRSYDASKPEEDLGRQQRKLLAKSQSLLLQDGFDHEQAASLQGALLSVKESTDIAQWANFIREASSASARREEHYSNKE